MAGDEQVSGARKATAGRTAREFFDGLWAGGDHWNLESAELDQLRYARQLDLLADRRYARALELGCGAGSFTRFLAPVCDDVLALDISNEAIGRAEHSRTTAGHVEFRVANIMDFDMGSQGPWDLVVLAETAYYLGWLYPLFDLGWLAHSLHDATRDGGRLLLVNSSDTNADGLMSPWLIRTYRDLFHNAGYQLETEETLIGTKDGVRFDILLSLFEKRRE